MMKSTGLTAPSLESDSLYGIWDCSDNDGFLTQIPPTPISLYSKYCHCSCTMFPRPLYQLYALLIMVSFPFLVNICIWKDPKCLEVYMPQGYPFTNDCSLWEHEWLGSPASYTRDLSVSCTSLQDWAKDTSWRTGLPQCCLVFFPQNPSSPLSDSVTLH